MTATGAMLDRLLADGRVAVDRGDLDLALATYEQAVAAAEESGERESRFLAKCNRASVLVAVGRGAEVAGELKTILIGSASDRNRYLAASALAIHHDLLELLPKARFYGQLALDHARKSGDSTYVARAGNLLGNLQVVDSYFDDAAASYEAALALLPEGDSLDRALLLSNLGYCCVVREQVGRAFALLFAGLRMMRRLGSGIWEVRSRARLSLCLAYLEIERYDRARVHGERGLAAAEELGDTEAVKKALYLLGELEKLDGRRLVAYSHFARLRDEFFPTAAGLADMLMATDTHKLINLMA